MTTALISLAAAAWPWDVDPDPELERALAFLEWDLTAETVLAAAYASASVVALTALPLSIAAPERGRPVAIVPLALAALVAFAAPLAPRWLAESRRSSALGAAPSLINRVTVGLALAPSTERAVRFAADGADGRLAESLRGHARRTASGPRSGLAAFAAEWRPWFPALGRACALAERAARATPAEREVLLDQATDVVREGVSDEVASFAASIRGPVTAVYAFGVLLPLSLVALLPALEAAGVPASLPLVVGVYDAALPVGLLVAVAWLLVERPASFPPPAVDRTHPDVPSRRWPIAVAGLTAAGLAGLAAAVLLDPWTVPVAAVGLGVGAGLVTSYRPMAVVRRDVREVESGLADALRTVGRRVERGESVEAAVAAVGADRSDRTGDVFADAAARQRRLGVGIEAAFRSRDGALGAVPSRRARGGAALLALAASEGRPAGTALIETGDHLDDLAALEREVRRETERVTSTLTNTAAVFGPLVGGATVALAGAMRGGTGLALTGSTPVSGLGLAVGWYVLVTAVLLTALATGLSRGPDRALVGYRVGLALPAATVTYLACFAGTGLTV